MELYEWAALWVGSVGLAYFIGLKAGFKGGRGHEKMEQEFDKIGK